MDQIAPVQGGSIYKAKQGLREELGSYVWNLDKNERPTEKPIDSFNHLLDALRYSVGFLYKRG